MKDPELRYLPTGTPNCSFTLAVDRGLSKQQKEQCEANGKPTTDFIRIVVWGKSAENSANYLAKGRLVAIQGRIQTSSYTDNSGNKKYSTDVIASNVEFLEWKDKQDNQPENNWYPEGFHPTDSDDIPF